jgi:nucleoside-diphosphate kinase
MDKTLALIKPDAVAKGHIGEIITAWERAGFKILAAKMIQFTRTQAEEFYRVHRDKPFFEKLLNFMIAGPCMALVLAGENVIQKNRKLMGNTNPALAEEGTLRKRFGTDNTANAVHGSDSPENARWEIHYLFTAFEILDYQHYLTDVFEKIDYQDH